MKPARILALLIFAVSLVGLPAKGVAQAEPTPEPPAVPESGAPDQENVRPDPSTRRRDHRPGVQPIQPERLDPQVESVLRAWETTTAKAKRFEAKFRRFKYDAETGEQRNGDGELVVEGAQNAMYTAYDKGIPVGGQAKSGHRIRWHLNDSTLTRIDDERHEYDQFILPFVPIAVIAELADFSDARTFMNGITVNQASLKFRVTLLKQTEGESWLRFVHRSHRAGEAVAIFDRETGLIKALKTVHSDRRFTVVHGFKDVQINPANPHGPDVGKPDLKGFRRVIHSSAEEDSASESGR